LRKGTKVKLVKNLTSSILFMDSANRIVVQKGKEGKVVGVGTGRMEGACRVRFDSDNQWWISNHFVEIV